MYKEELRKAQEKDRKKISDLEGMVKQLRETHESLHENFGQRAQELMKEQLKVRVLHN